MYASCARVPMEPSEFSGVSVEIVDVDAESSVAASRAEEAASDSEVLLPHPLELFGVPAAEPETETRSAPPLLLLMPPGCCRETGPGAGPVGVLLRL